MNWDTISLFTSDLLGLALAVRFLALRLHRVYRVFCVFLLFDIVSSTAYFVEMAVEGPNFDSRALYIGVSVISWFLTFWMVYALLDAMLVRLPGILRFSRRLLNAVFAATTLIALLAVQPSFSAHRDARALLSLGPAMRLVLTLERVISITALSVLLTILAFVLWFPVQMPKNLVLFSLGFIVYFSVETLFLLVSGHLPDPFSAWFSPVTLFLLSACYAYWGLTITPEGESVPLRIGHSWQAVEQTRLLGQLEAMNASLSRGVRR